jgi:methionyl-tRNA formyltransferase
MRIAIIGKTKMLLEAAETLNEAGHAIPLVVTQRAKDDYETTADDFQAFAEKIGADFVKDGKINSPDIRARLKASDCDVAFTIN